MKNDFTSIPGYAQPRLAHSLFGRNLLTLSSVDSTNRYAKQLITEKTIGEGTVILADEQVQGKGRLGRSWVSSPGVGLWMSVVTEPALPQPQWFLLTFMSALAVAESIEHTTGLSAQLKWPNDVLIHQKKCCGILLESMSANEKNFMILGIGINVNQASFPYELRDKATSLLIESGKEISRAELFVTLMLRLSDLYRSPDASIVRQWKRRAEFLNRPVTVTESNREFDAIARDISDDGGLIVESGGTTRTIYAGDVQIKLR